MPAWRLLEGHDEGLFDEDGPPNCEPGYLLQVGLPSPYKYKRFTFFRGHPVSSYYEWPLSYKVTDEWIDDFLAAHPEFDKSKWAACISYGYLINRREQRYPEEDPPKWLTALLRGKRCRCCNNTDE